MGIVSASNIENSGEIVKGGENYKSLVQMESSVEQENNKQQIKNGLKLLHFECINTSIEDEVQGLNMNAEGEEGIQIDIIGQKEIVVRYHWQSMQEIYKYVSNMIKMHQIGKISLYNEIIICNQQKPYISQSLIQDGGVSLTDYKNKCQNPLQQLDLLIFIADIFENVLNIWIQPSYIYHNTKRYFLVCFNQTYVNQTTIFLAFILWLFSNNQTFHRCVHFNQEVYLQTIIPIHLKEIYQQISSAEHIDFRYIKMCLKEMKQKLSLLSNNIDSFHACILYNKIKKPSKEWILAKEYNMVYFLNVNDLHCCKGFVVRKNKAIDIEGRNMIFDENQLSIKFIPENSKIMVCANEFELEQHCSLSDIQIKHKFPVKFNDPLIIQAENYNITILDQNIYRYSPNTNRLIQQTKKISDYIYLAQYSLEYYLVIRLSIDILRNGIRLFTNGNEIILLIAGNQQLLRQISSVRIDIKAVEFCIEAYSGVFIMMANKNLWVLDLNFTCFFSYVSAQRLKEYYSFNKNVNSQNYAFEILNQSFNVQFLKNHSDMNNILSKNQLLTIGKVMGKLYYLRYKFLPKIGAIELVSFMPLFVQFPMVMAAKRLKQDEVSSYVFNFHQEYANHYKYQQWIFKSTVFIKVFDLNIQWSKFNYKALLEVQQIQISLKQYLENTKKNKKNISKSETLLLLLKMLQYMEHLSKTQITHKNFNVSNIYFTKTKQLKLIGWSQPPRNWYVCDYKDYLLTCLNIITVSSHEKISQKILSKHQQQLKQYPLIQQYLVNSYKLAKHPQKKNQIEKYLINIRDYLEKEICKHLENKIENKSQNKSQNRYVFSFQFNTPRFSLVDTQTQKIKKMSVQIQNEIQQFTFKRDDRYMWNQQACKLYVLNSNFKFLQIFINMQIIKEQHIKAQDYQYLPNNLLNSSLIYIKDRGLYSFGGIIKNQQGNNVICKTVYAFNHQKLCWEVHGQITKSLVNPLITLSSCQKYVYLIGGQIDIPTPFFSTIQYDLSTNQSKQLIDKSMPNPFKSLHYKNPIKIFHISSSFNIFAVFTISGGNYNVTYMACIKGGFCITAHLKQYIEDKEDLTPLAFSYKDRNFYILRPYGKYSKISFQKLSLIQAKNQTLYSS